MTEDMIRRETDFKQKICELYPAPVQQNRQNELRQLQMSQIKTELRTKSDQKGKLDCIKLNKSMSNE